MGPAEEMTIRCRKGGCLSDSKTIPGEKYYEVAGAEGGCYEVSHGGGLEEDPVLAEEWEAMAPHKESYRYYQFGMSNTPVSKASVNVGDVTSTAAVECSCDTKKAASGKMLLTRPWDPGEAEIDAAKVSDDTVEVKELQEDDFIEERNPDTTDVKVEGDPRA